MTHASPGAHGAPVDATGTDAPISGDENTSFWRSHAQISLQPVAAPSILGLYAFAAATFMVATNIAGWYGTVNSPLILFPFAAAFGGVAQFLAGMWAYRARDALATAMHGMWGSFWVAFGVYHLMIALGSLPAPGASRTAEVAFGYWFIVLAAITWIGALAATAENLSLALTLGVLAAGATLLAIAHVGNVSVAETAAGYVLLASAVLAFYVASSMLLQSTFGRVVLPLGKVRAPNRPGAIPTQPIQYELGEPGVKVGQ